MWWNLCKNLILLVLLRCVSPDFLQKAEDDTCWIWFCWPYSSTHPFICSTGFNQTSPVLWERLSCLLVLRSLLLLRSFPFQCCCLTSVCHIPDPPPAQPLSLLFSLSPIRQPHQNCKLGNVWGSTSHYEQLIEFHTKNQKTLNTSPWGNPTEETKDKLCQTALWNIKNTAAIEAQFSGTF